MSDIHENDTRNRNTLYKVRINIEKRLLIELYCNTFFQKNEPSE